MTWKTNIDRQPEAWIWKAFSIIGSQTELSVLANRGPGCVSSYKTDQPSQNERWWKESKLDSHYLRLRRRSRVCNGQESLQAMFFSLPSLLSPFVLYVLQESETPKAACIKREQGEQKWGLAVKCLVLHPEIKLRRGHSPRWIVIVQKERLSALIPPLL